MTSGKPNFFDIDKYLDSVEGMITADEVERALWMLDNPPAWYRDNEPERLKEIRRSLHAALFTPAQYAMADKETETCDPNQLKNYHPPRAQILANFIRIENEKGFTPNILEVGPGSFWLPHSLAAQGLGFRYASQSLGGVGYESELNPDGPNFFVAFELIEHLSNEYELLQAYLKFKRPATKVFLSTPLYTWAGGMREWRRQALGHLRAYTPTEFGGSAKRIFTDFTFREVTLCPEDCTMVAVGWRA